MSAALSVSTRLVVSVVLLAFLFTYCSFSATTWNGVLRDAAGKPVAEAKITLRASSGDRSYEARTTAGGTFVFAGVEAGTYTLAAEAAGKIWTAAKPIVIAEGSAPNLELTLSAQNHSLTVVVAGPAQGTDKKGTGGEHLSSEEVSGLPLNERDFSKLLLLAAGTMTDTNGAANFTQQFAFNGQRGVTTVFAMDGGTTTDPELGGATFSNFNVDAIHEVQSNSGVMPAEIGHGAASYTNVVSNSGTNKIHGTVFEFVRNAAFDARNYFDPPKSGSGRRIPPFVRNEFGFTIGGPVVLPAYNGRDRTFFFGEYQGFRQVLGTTQVVRVPTKAERQGIDTTTYPGDTLTVPVNAA